MAVASLCPVAIQEHDQEGSECRGRPDTHTVSSWYGHGTEGGAWLHVEVITERGGAARTSGALEYRPRSAVRSQ